LPPAYPGLLKIKKSINKIGAVFKTGNVPEFATRFRESISDLVNLLKKETLLTDQTPDDDPLKIIIDKLQEDALAFSKTPLGMIPSDGENQQFDDYIDIYFEYISAMYSQKTTGARGVGETNGAGKFMHSYHA
jgi:hypothetical protein